VPRRNQGPIVQLDTSAGVAISIQYAGASGTRELDAFRGFVLARDLEDFERAAQFFDVPALNFACADVNGDIGYFLGAEVPLREDLQAGEVSGLPPTFLRNGRGGNEWLEPSGPDPMRALPFEILPAREMPRLFNPLRGFIVSANNDPTGATLDNDPFNERRPDGGILYFGTNFALGVRAGRITELLDERVARRGRITTSDMKEIQADTVMNEARYFTRFIVGAFDAAQKPSAHAALRQAAADPRVVEAVGRLRRWDGSTPTGLREGYDKKDRPGSLREPSAQEIQHSVAATIYAIWRNQFASHVVVSTLNRRGLPFFNSDRDDVGEVLPALRNLLDNFEERRGIGASGIDFFEVPGVADPATRRDLIVLRSLASALDRLAGDGYKDAFKRSTNQNDYRWGRLHRVLLPHPIGRRFSTPPAFDAFPAPLADLPGIPIDGGLWTVDVGNNLLLLDDSPNPLDAFVVRTAAAQRYVARVRPFGTGFDAENVLAGGQSAIPGSPFYQNLLERWLTNETYPFRQNSSELAGSVASFESFQPVRR
jgi:penicillin amidase